MPCRDGDLVDADDLGLRGARYGELVLHILLIEFLAGVPVESEFLRNLGQRR